MKEKKKGLFKKKKKKSGCCDVKIVPRLEFEETEKDSETEESKDD